MMGFFLAIGGSETWPMLGQQVKRRAKPIPAVDTAWGQRYLAPMHRDLLLTGDLGIGLLGLLLIHAG